MTREEAMCRAVEAAERAEAAAELSNASAHDCALAYVAVAGAWVRVAALSPSGYGGSARPLQALPPPAKSKRRAEP